MTLLELYSLELTLLSEWCQYFSFKNDSRDDIIVWRAMGHDLLTYLVVMVVVVVVGN